MFFLNKICSNKLGIVTSYHRHVESKIHSYGTRLEAVSQWLCYIALWIFFCRVLLLAYCLRFQIQSYLKYDMIPQILNRNSPEDSYLYLFFSVTVLYGIFNVYTFHKPSRHQLWISVVNNLVLQTRNTFLRKHSDLGQVLKVNTWLLNLREVSLQYAKLQQLSRRLIESDKKTSEHATRFQREKTGSDKLYLNLVKLTIVLDALWLIMITILGKSNLLSL